MAIQLLPAANYDGDGGENGKSKILTAVVDAGWIFEIESLPCDAIPYQLGRSILTPYRFYYVCYYCCHIGLLASGA